MKATLAIATCCLTFMALANAAADFVRLGDMTTARSGHTATLLRDGRVLIAGGDEDGRSAELYEPATRTFVPTGMMLQARGGHAATLLPDGRVLMAGGVPMLEFYDPVDGTFSAGPAMRASARFGTLLPDGRVLYAHGLETELFDPVARTSRPGAAFLQPGPWLEIYYDAATRLADGRVLFTGYGPTQVYDPVLDRFTLAGPPDLCELLVSGVEAHTATLLRDGKVLVAGGMNDEFMIGAVDLAELFDPAANAFQHAGKLARARNFHAAVALDDGRVLIVGGQGKTCDFRDCYPGGSIAKAEIYDPATGTFAAAGELNVARTLPRATLLEGGDVLITGGHTFCGMWVDCFRPREAAAELYRARVSPSANAVTVVEYANAVFDRYFMTADPYELAIFEEGYWAGWSVSGRFDAWAAPDFGLDPVCAFSPRRPRTYRPSGTQLPTRFYTVEPAECEMLKNQYGWVYEGTAFYAARLRDGQCPPGMRALWRAFNNYSDFLRIANHRYSTNLATLDAMTSRGWTVDGPAMCVP